VALKIQNFNFETQNSDFVAKFISMPIHRKGYSRSEKRALSPHLVYRFLSTTHKF
jgi:hypothetical protein